MERENRRKEELKDEQGVKKKIILKQQLWSISWLSIPGVPRLLGFIRLASFCMRMLCQYINMLPLQSFFNKSERERQAQSA